MVKRHVNAIPTGTPKGGGLQIKAIYPGQAGGAPPWIAGGSAGYRRVGNAVMTVTIGTMSV
jgi:hypothetical protein